MYKASKKDIKFLLEATDSENIKAIFKGIQPNGYEVAYFAPKNANCCYRILITKLDNQVFEVVTQFGSVLGGRYLYV